jgi:site-specific DNA recombinase
MELLIPLTKLSCVIGVITRSAREIMDKLALIGVNLTEKHFRGFISNPFYVGYVTGKLVNGKLIKGHHPALIDLETFLKANNILNEAPTCGIAKTHKVEELPLKIFARDKESNCKLTGYIKKGHWYYKTRNKSGKVNINAEKLHRLFIDLLQSFECNKLYKGKLKIALKKKLETILADKIKDSIQLKKRVTEITSQLEGIEERFVLGNLAPDLFEKYKAKYGGEISALKLEMGKNEISSSNHEKIIEKGILIAGNLSQLWISADFTNKQKLQYLVFPEGILYNKKNHTVRTDKINSLFAAIPHLKQVLGDKEKGNSEKNCLKSTLVPGTGIEPAHPCGRQILSLLRLPISPPGQQGCKCKL